MQVVWYPDHLASPPSDTQSNMGSDHWSRWPVRIRQVIEAVDARLHLTFLLSKQPHELTDFRAPLAAKIALLNFCIWLNTRLERERMGFAELLGW